ncbi:MAG: helix-turn-helix transcriptional regulator [bacterium]
MRENKKHNPPNYLRLYRLDQELKLSDVAILLDIKSIGRISEWENGTSNPSIEHLISLGLIYHRLPDELYFQLRKSLSKKLVARYKLLKKKQEQKRKYAEDG